MDLEVPSPGRLSLDPGKLWAHYGARLNGHRLPSTPLFFHSKLPEPPGTSGRAYGGTEVAWTEQT